MKLRITSAAEADIVDAFEWYRERNPLVAAGFLAAVDAGMQVISEHPKVKQVIHRGVRKMLLRRFPYFLLYRLDPSEVVVVGCFHGKRSPTVWKRRAE